MSSRIHSALQALLDFAESNECQHDETYRGGAIWTICTSCGMKWADDRGGKPEYVEPPVITEARAALEESKKALAEGENPGIPLPRYGIEWRGPTEPVAVLKPDGYWTPWHLASANRDFIASAHEMAASIEKLKAENEWLQKEVSRIAPFPTETNHRRLADSLRVRAEAAEALLRRVEITELRK